MKYLVITQYGQYGDAFVEFESDDLEAARKHARIFAADDKKDAHTFITTRDEWEDCNYNEIDF